MREVKQIKEKEDENSLFDEIKFKSQAAMEYLMTYGWAILIIALSLVVLYSLGIMNPKNFIPRAPPGSCFVFRPNGPGTTDFVSLQGTCGYLPMYVASFDGVGSYVEVPHSTTLEPTEFTLSLWIFPVQWNHNPTATALIAKRVLTSNGYIIFWLASTNTINWDWGGYSYRWNTGYLPPLNTWTHLVFVRDSAGRRLYVNGALQASTTDAGASVTSGSVLRIGMDTYAAEYWFKGLIYGVGIYNTALTPQEIRYLYQQGLGGGPVRLQNLVAWWPLNGDAKDYSGNNNHGTINGGVTFVQNYNPP